MRASEVLFEEHRVIVRVLDCLDAMAKRFVTEDRIDETAARRVIDFLRQFADRFHHGKEEVHFFPMMEARGFPRHGGPTGVMIMEHEEGRARVRGLEAAVDGRDPAAFARSASAFCALLRQHIEKEDHCLFAMADNAFSVEDQEELARRFRDAEETELAGLGETYRRLAEMIEMDAGVEPSGSAAARDGGRDACGRAGIRS